MTYIYVDNWETGETKKFDFEYTYEAEDFASNYVLGETKELSISDGIMAIEWEDYLFMCHH